MRLADASEQVEGGRRHTVLGDPMAKAGEHGSAPGRSRGLPDRCRILHERD